MGSGQGANRSTAWDGLHMLTALRRNWLVALLAALAVMVCATAALALVPKSYKATAVVAMAPRAEARPAGDLFQLVIAGYAILASSPEVADDLGGTLGLKPGTLAKAIETQNPPASNTLYLSVTWNDPATAAKLANGLADQVVKAASADPLLTGTVVAGAIAPDQPSWPPRRATLVAGAVLALAAACAAALLADRSRRREA
jgi:uncharacterized protein involved in exopolysaccharide biosynthesis